MVEFHEILSQASAFKQFKRTSNVCYRAWEVRVSAEQLKLKLGVFRFYLLAIIVVGGAAFAGFWYGHPAAEKSQLIINSLTKNVEQLNQENHRLTRQINILSVELEVAKLTNQSIQNQLQTELNTANDLRKTVSFYQQVMAPELTADGFEIYSIDVKPRKSDGFYTFSATLMQKQSKVRPVKGSITFEVFGSLNGEPHVYQPFSKNDIIVPLSFSFKYFETVSQVLELPMGFIPEELLVKANVVTSKRRNVTHEQRFEWPIR